MHRVITVYNDMFDHIDGIMWALAKKKTQWTEDLFFAVKVAVQMLSKYYSGVTPMTGMHLISAHIFDSFRKSRSFWKSDKEMDSNADEDISYTTHYEEAFLEYVDNEYCATYQCVLFNKLECIPSSNLVPSIMASGSC